jgi:hypothetical protein
MIAYNRLPRLTKTQRIMTAYALEQAKEITLSELRRTSPQIVGEEPDAWSELLARSGWRKTTNRVEVLLQTLLLIERTRTELLSRCHPEGLLEHQPAFTKEQLADKKNVRLIVQLRNAEERANRLLKRYRSSQKIETARLALKKATSTEKPSCPYERNELTAVSFIMSHVGESGLEADSELWRFRRCAKCSIWLYAERDHLAYCSSRCRKAHFRTAPECKDKRRRNAKESRDEFKEQWLILPGAKFLREGSPRKGKETEFVTRKVNAFRAVQREKHPAFKSHTSSGSHSRRRAPEPIFQKSVKRNWNAIVAASKSPDLDKQFEEMKYWSKKQ